MNELHLSGQIHLSEHFFDTRRGFLKVSGNCFGKWVFTWPRHERNTVIEQSHTLIKQLWFISF